MTYTDAQVAKGRKLVATDAAAKLELGDLLLEVAPMGQDGVNTASTTVLADFADKIGISFESAE